MNILFFLTPKAETVFVFEDDTVGEALKKMKKFRYAAIPVISKSGLYRGTIAEGDLLWKLKAVCDNREDLNKFYNTKIRDVKKRRKIEPVIANCKMEALLGKAISQNFVPVVDDNLTFIGIVTRSTILTYCQEQLREKEDRTQEILVQPSDIDLFAFMD